MKAMDQRPFQRRLIQIAVASCFATAAYGNPTGPSVVSGAATFNAVGKNLTITNSPGAIINWQGFSIRADEVTRFVQSGAASAVLNRVTGAQQSQLLGQLLSNGRVFLINPNGVTIGAGVGDRHRRLRRVQPQPLERGFPRRQVPLHRPRATPGRW